MENFRYIIPQGSPMAGIGNNLQMVSLSNCFVIGNEVDSYGAIMRIDEEQVQLMKRRGGVGHDLSYLRPKGTPVMNSALTSTGIVPFMERYSNSTREVAQDGRRGALMLSISIKHPDAEGFIDAKMTSGKVTAANVSVRVDDEFMKAALEGKPYVQQYPVESSEPTLRKEINAKGLWKKITHNAWKSAEPGLLFWDTIIRESIPDCYADLGFKTVGTNPCAEIPLCVYDSCRLLVQNLFSYVKNPFTKEASFDMELFKEHSRYAQRMMDDIVDLEIEKIDQMIEKIDRDPEPEDIKSVERNLWVKIRDKSIRGRRTGIGITAEGDMLAALSMRYGSDEAIEFSTNIHKTMALEVYRSSVETAKERGAFPIYDAKREENNPLIQRIKEADPKLYEDMVTHGRRNIALMTIAPAGTVSLMAQTTSGVEPAFLTIYERRRKVNPNDKRVNIDYVDEVGDSWEKFKVFHHKFADWLEANGYNVDEVKSIADASVRSEDKKIELEEIIAKSPYHLATANDVNWLAKVKLQGAIQKWVDHSISVTINLPKDASEELVEQLYETAWKEGCKGVTVYVDESRSGVLIKAGDLEDKVKLIQQKVKLHPALEIKPQAIKYRIKREVNQDTLHIIATSDLYIDDKNAKAYFIPNEDFQIRAPLGAATSVSFGQSGMDRTEILRGPNPDWAEIVTRLQSAYSNEDEGMGPRRIKSIEHGVGLAFEDYFLRNGIIRRDPVTSKIVNTVRKADLRKVDRKSDEYDKIMSQVRVESDEEIEIGGNHGKLDKKFVCEFCGGEEYSFESGCHNPKCKSCGQYKGGGCG